LIARAHQLAAAGYKYYFSDKSTVTVWSAPNYCYRCGNIGSVLQVNDSNLNNNHFILFSEVPDCKRQQPPKITIAYFM
jgi:hypothetical protein